MMFESTRMMNNLVDFMEYTEERFGILDNHLKMANMRDMRVNGSVYSLKGNSSAHRSASERHVSERPVSERPVSERPVSEGDDVSRQLLKEEPQIAEVSQCKHRSADTQVCSEIWGNPE